jgi:16S rRNA processing protein RimM
MSEADEAWREMIAVGRVVRPHGHRGHVVIEPETDRAEERFSVGATLYARRGERIEPLTVQRSRRHDRRWIVGFDRVTTIDEAEALRDVELKIPVETLPVLAAGAYYVHDLVGCRLETLEGRAVGRVTRVDLGTGVPLLAVAAPGGEVLVPLAEAICRRVDVDAKIIVVDPPEGLLDLNRARRGAGNPAAQR